MYVHVCVCVWGGGGGGGGGGSQNSIFQHPRNEILGNKNILLLRSIFAKLHRHTERVSERERETEKGLDS